MPPTPASSNLRAATIRDRERRHKYYIKSLNRYALGYQSGRAFARAPQQELKCFDVTPGNLNFITSGTGTTVQVYNSVPQGSEVYQRIGRKIYMKSLAIRGQIQQIATSVTDVGRILVVYDSQANGGGFPSAGSLLQDCNAGVNTNGFSHININNRQRFKILRDYQVILPSATFVAGVVTNLGYQDNIIHTHMVDWYIPLKGLEAIFNVNSTGAVTDIQSGSLLIFCVSNAGDNKYTFSLTTRLRYYD